MMKTFSIKNSEIHWISEFFVIVELLKFWLSAWITPETGMYRGAVWDFSSFRINESQKASAVHHGASSGVGHLTTS